MGANRPEGDAALFRRNDAITHNDQRRVRATAVAVLRQAADSGDTLLLFETFMLRLHDRFPGKRQCLADREAFWSGEDRPFYDAILWFKEEPYPDSWRIDNSTDDKVVAATDVDDELAEDLGADENEDTTPIIKLIALKSVRRQEVEIAKVFEAVRKLDDLPSLPDWRALLTDKNTEGGFGPPQTKRESEAAPWPQWQHCYRELHAH